MVTSRRGAALALGSLLHVAGIGELRCRFATYYCTYVPAVVDPVALLQSPSA
jgi:hypothetical protein